MIEEFFVEREGGWELPEERAKFLVEGEQAGGEEIGEWDFDIAKAADVGDVAASFYGENEVFRRVAVPALVAGGSLEGVEGAVEFDGRELAAGEFEFASLR